MSGVGFGGDGASPWLAHETVMLTVKIAVRLETINSMFVSKGSAIRFCCEEAMYSMRPILL